MSLVCSTLKIDRFDLVTHDIGNMVGYALAAQHPDRIIKWAIIDAPLPGIGPWTAHGFLIVALDQPDVLLSGDLALRRAVRKAYGFDHPPNEDEMAQLAARWRPYRSLAVSYLFASEF